MFWIVIGAVMVFINLWAAVANDFLWTLTWGNGFVVGAWGAIVWVGMWKHIGAYLRSKQMEKSP
jgi:hypothetical protein